MRRVIILAATIIFLTQVSGFAAEVNEPNDNNGIGQQAAEAAGIAKKPRQKFDTVTIADFYMRDGSPVSGKLLSDDKNQIVIEQLSESTVVTKTLSKRDVDTRTLRTRIVPEWQYYTQIGEYFAARTWDFKDDPDDFIAAIRSYEKAKQSLQASGIDDERLAGTDKAIDKLKKDRDVWTAQVESRAKLKKLEYDAEAENRLKALEKQVAESRVKLNESIKYLDKSTADIKADYQRLEKSISGINKDFVQQIQRIQAQLEEHRLAINDLANRLLYIQNPSGGRP